MSTLIMIGNINQFTFANAILSANEKSKELFGGNGLEKIHVFHTPESIIELNSKLDKDDGWNKFLEDNSIGYEKFIHRTIRINTNRKDEDALEKFANDIEEIVNNSEKIIIDLSNGAIFHRNLLSIISYILNIKYQYIIDITILSKLTKERGFLDTKILKQSYLQVPESHKLDSLAYLDLSEMKRYKSKIKELGQKFYNIFPERADINFFEENLAHSIDIKLKGNKNKDNTLFRISSVSIASSAEELINLLLDKKGNDNYHLSTFGQKLDILFEILKKEDRNIDLEFLKKFNNFIVFLRNKTTHKSSQNFLSDTEKFKAELSIAMSLEFIEYYTDIVYPSIKKDISENNQEIIVYPEEPLSNEDYYFGIDGDNTGAYLEKLLINEDIRELKIISKKITKALNAIENYIKEVFDKNEYEIIFKTGDDMLLRGRLSFKDLKKIQEIYKETTDSLTCSIGFGKTSKDAYMALKLAKANPQKNMIKGICFTK